MDHTALPGNAKEPASYDTDVLILGIGSAGVGAVYRALTGGVRVIGVEACPGPGGTSTYGGVNNWEPGISLPGLHTEIARRLMASSDGFVAKTTAYVSADTRWAVSDRCGDPYESTLARFGLQPDAFRRFHYEPDAMAQVMNDLMAEADPGGHLSLYYNSRFVSLTTDSRTITACTVQTPNGVMTIRPRLVIDCTADIAAARMAGCAYAIGEDASADFGETAAPAAPTSRLNGITQSFRITHTIETITQIPEQYRDVDLSDWEAHMESTCSPVSCFDVYPRGGICVNMLPTAEGELYLRHSYDELRHICEARAFSYMRWLARRYGLTGWQITHLFPLLGLRETYRLRGEYVLTIDDLHRGCPKGTAARHPIAVADHPADTHGQGSQGCQDTGRYTIPYECLLPREIDNLLVACRGASFSHLAASSARLSRTMLQLGEAAGTAAARSLASGVLPRDLPYSRLAELDSVNL